MEEEKNIFLYLILIKIILLEKIFLEEVKEKIMNLINLWEKWINLNKEKLKNGEKNFYKIIQNIKLEKGNNKNFI